MQQGVIFKDFLKHYILYQKQAKKMAKNECSRVSFFCYYLLNQSKENGTKERQINKAGNSKTRAQSKKSCNSSPFFFALSKISSRIKNSIVSFYFRLIFLTKMFFIGIVIFFILETILHSVKCCYQMMTKLHQLIMIHSYTQFCLCESRGPTINDV